MNTLNHSFHERAIGFVFVFGSILFTVYGQMIAKWQVGKAGPLPAAFLDKIPFMVNLLLNPWIISAMAAGFGALICWLAAMTKFELSYVYPFTSLAFVLVLVLSVIIFHEALTIGKVTGLLLIMLGIVVASRG
jgi:multidrug transporter EmrE-like cation transporter